ncbi:MAG: VanW family protein [Candidatus Yanofskybacteria bacterium]|nr:VanW family protein [Candidatus Yanofskybacteria bacterium]
MEARRTSPVAKAQELPLPIKISKPAFGEADNLSGITELIGKATTRFTGSPTNRISNIKNGVKFLTGLIVKPGEEFSTLQALGTIDNTTGYLPELVIKGDRTTPEFGGGLCQVSTTLFRAVMNAGLPVTARRNHSYRVAYYENDGAGRRIGPGLDATIYEPDPDFKFKNDTANPIVIIGTVEGDKVTFELFGTGDGRSSEIKGPTLLTEIPAGPPMYVETDTLAPGVVKQIETAHPGGTTTATYIITYADGQKVSQVFKSSYRRWPARYLVGASSTTTSPTPTPSPSPSL